MWQKFLPCPAFPGNMQTQHRNHSTKQYTGKEYLAPWCEANIGFIWQHGNRQIIMFRIKKTNGLSSQEYKHTWQDVYPR